MIYTLYVSIWLLRSQNVRLFDVSVNWLISTNFLLAFSYLICSFFNKFLSQILWQTLEVATIHLASQVNSVNWYINAMLFYVFFSVVQSCGPAHMWTNVPTQWISWDGNNNLILCTSLLTVRIKCWCVLVARKRWSM